MPKNADGTEVADEKDPLTNHKAEVDRKLGNVSDAIKGLQDTNKALLAQLAALAPKPAPVKEVEDDDLKGLVYDNPEKFAEVIEKRAEKKVMDRVNQASAGAQKETKIIQDLRDNYPELYDGNSALTKRAIEIFNAYPQEDKLPISYKLAVKEAAEELGVVPKSKRPDDDEPVRGGNSGTGSGGRKRKAGLDERTLDFARNMGLDVDDPKVVERLKGRQRENHSEEGGWGKYQ